MLSKMKNYRLEWNYPRYIYYSETRNLKERVKKIFIVSAMNFFPNNINVIVFDLSKENLYLNLYILFQLLEKFFLTSSIARSSFKVRKCNDILISNSKVMVVKVVSFTTRSEINFLVITMINAQVIMPLSSLKHYISISKHNFALRVTDEVS